MAPRLVLLFALTCALLACSREDPAVPVLPEPAPAAEASASPGGMGPRPSPAPAPAPDPAPEAPVDPATVMVPPLDEETRAALAALVTVQRSIAAEASVEKSDPDHYDLQVSPRARDVFPSLKRASREAARRVIGAGLRAGERSPAVLAIQVTKAFLAAGVAMQSAESRAPQQTHGTIVEVEVARPAGHPTKLGVVVTLSLPCGSDGSLYVLEERPGLAPGVILAVEASGYTSISGGNLALTYRLSLPDDHGGFFAVVATSSPWCTSAWRGIDYGVYVPGPTPETPRRIFHQSDGAYLSNALCDIEAGRDDFQVSYTSWTTFRDDVMRGHVRHYVRRGGSFERAQPVAAEPIDLPQEWVSMPWPEARRYVAGPNPDALRPWHEVLARSRREFGAKLAVESEDASAGTARLSLTCKGCKALPGKLLLDVRRDGAGWAMEAVTPAR